MTTATDRSLLICQLNEILGSPVSLVTCPQLVGLESPPLAGLESQPAQSVLLCEVYGGRSWTPKQSWMLQCSITSGSPL